MGQQGAGASDTTRESTDLLFEASCLPRAPIVDIIQQWQTGHRGQDPSLAGIHQGNEPPRRGDRNWGISASLRWTCSDASRRIAVEPHRSTEEEIGNLASGGQVHESPGCAPHLPSRPWMRMLGRTSAPADCDVIALVLLQHRSLRRTSRQLGSVHLLVCGQGGMRWVPGEGT